MAGEPRALVGGLDQSSAFDLTCKSIQCGSGRFGAYTAYCSSLSGMGINRGRQLDSTVACLPAGILSAVGRFALQRNDPHPIIKVYSHVEGICLSASRGKPRTIDDGSLGRGVPCHFIFGYLILRELLGMALVLFKSKPYMSIYRQLWQNYNIGNTSQLGLLCTNILYRVKVFSADLCT